jgi:hypothetical protein
MPNGILYIPFWRAGGWNEITYRTQLYIAPLSQEPVRLGVFLFENGGKPWAGKSFDIEIDQHVDRVMTNRDGMLDIRVGPNQTVRIEINVLEHEYGNGEVHLLSGTVPVPLLARGELETFAAEPSGGFEMSTSEITITGGRPEILEPGR